MAQYVLRHGGISLGTQNSSVGVPLMPSEDPDRPTVVELDEAEAKRIIGNVSGQLLPGSRDKGPCLVPLAEWKAELEAAKASAAAKAKVLDEAKAKASAPAKADEKHGKGGGK